jgi:PRTase ComF-like
LAVDHPDTRSCEFSLYFLDGTDAATVTSSSPPFSAAQYSRYKYGSVAAAEAFAHALGEAFCECRPEFVRVPKLLMTSPPYPDVPTAATTVNRGQKRRVSPRT